MHYNTRQTAMATGTANPMLNLTEEQIQENLALL